MCRMRALGAALALTALVAGTPTAVTAQQTEEELIQRLQELQPLVDQAREEAHEAELRYEADLRASQETTVDTLRVGPLTVVAPLDEVDQAREMYGSVWETEFAPYVTHSEALDRVLFTFSWSAQPKRIVMTGPHRRVEARFWYRRAAVEGFIKEAIGRTLEDDLKERSESGVGPAAIYGWAVGAVGRPESPQSLYRQLATTPAKISRDCLDGVPLACWTALGVEVTPESLNRWYTPDERRALVLRGRYWITRNSANQDQRRACLQGRFESCDALLAERAHHRGLTPVTAAGRMAMVWVALELGGEGAWDRLLEDRDMPAVDALLYASGATRQELETRWRELVLENKPEVHAGLSTTKWMVLFWVLVFTAFALRSTRWRLG